MNSYSVKVNGTDRVTVRNRATLRKILPPVPIHNLESVQDPVLSVPSAEPAGSRDSGRRQPPGFVERAGLRSGVRSSNNIVVSGDTGSRVQKEVESCELVLRAASEMANPGVLRVLRSLPRAGGPSAESVPVQSGGGPGQSGSRELSSEGGLPGAGAAGAGTAGGAGGADAAGGDTPGRGGLSAWAVMTG